MRHDRWRSFLRITEWTLLLVAVVCLGRYSWLTYRINRLEAENREAVARMIVPRAQGPSAALSPQPSALSPHPSALGGGDPAVIGALDIPRLRLSAAVRVGDDENALAGAIGYLPDTAPPWEKGNSAFAAHRDRIFRPLAKIRIGDEIMLSTRRGNFEYRVSQTLIVDPGDVWILEPEPGVDLTLITCYPFVYVGHAPQRFVVRARKVDVARPVQAREPLGSVRPGPDVERQGDE